ncbi:MAG: hypothetical protein H7328_11495 [Bdellovibrio sp.]|nr:hypothetical protein [Bdellovibrio sp.]
MENQKKMCRKKLIEKGASNMEKIADGVLTIAYLALVTVGGGYTIERKAADPMDLISLPEMWSFLKMTF